MVILSTPPASGGYSISLILFQNQFLTAREGSVYQENPYIRNTYRRQSGGEQENIIYLIFIISDYMKEYTRAQLALRNGQDREEIWCSYKGLIYDVAPSRLWRNGKHYEHWAGQDLTKELDDAPHTAAVFDRFTIIGKLIN